DVEGRHGVLVCRVDQYLEPSPRQSEVQPEHAGPVEPGSRVVGIGGDYGGPRQLSLRREITVGVVHGEDIAVRFEESSAGMSGERIANLIDIHCASRAIYRSSRRKTSVANHKNQYFVAIRPASSCLPEQPKPITDSDNAQKPGSRTVARTSGHRSKQCERSTTTPLAIASGAPRDRFGAQKIAPTEAGTILLEVARAGVEPATFRFSGGRSTN